MSSAASRVPKPVLRGGGGCFICGAGHSIKACDVLARSAPGLADNSRVLGAVVARCKEGDAAGAHTIMLDFVEGRPLGRRPSGSAAGEVVSGAASAAALAPSPPLPPVGDPPASPAAAFTLNKSGRGCYLCASPHDVRACPRLPPSLATGRALFGFVDKCKTGDVAAVRAMLSKHAARGAAAGGSGSPAAPPSPTPAAPAASAPAPPMAGGGMRAGSWADAARSSSGALAALPSAAAVSAAPLQGAAPPPPPPPLAHPPQQPASRQAPGSPLGGLHLSGSTTGPSPADPPLARLPSTGLAPPRFTAVAWPPSVGDGGGGRSGGGPPPPLPDNGSLSSFLGGAYAARDPVLSSFSAAAGGSGGGGLGRGGGGGGPPGVVESVLPGGAYGHAHAAHAPAQPGWGAQPALTWPGGGGWADQAQQAQQAQQTQQAQQAAAYGGYQHPHPGAHPHPQPAAHYGGHPAHAHPPPPPHHLSYGDPASLAADTARQAAIAGDYPSLEAAAATGGGGGPATPAGLRNRAGEYNCFLNVVLQALWASAGFGRALVSALSAHRPADPVAASLVGLMEGFAAAEEDKKGGGRGGGAGGRAVVDPAPLRAALAAASGAAARLPSASGKGFAVGEMADAAEVLGALWEAAARAGPAGADCVSSAFGARVAEVVTCARCGARAPAGPPHTSLIHTAPAAALRAVVAGRPPIAFGKALQAVAVGSRTCGGCGSPAPAVPVVGPPLPRAFVLQLAWDSPAAPPDVIAGTLAAMGEELDLADLYGAAAAAAAAAGAANGGGGAAHHQPPHPPSSTTRYALSAAICFYGSHYSALVAAPGSGTTLGARRAYDLMDDASASRVGAWPDVVARCVAGRVQPAVLFYDRVGAVAAPPSPPPPPPPPPAAAAAAFVPSAPARSGWAAIAARPPAPLSPRGSGGGTAAAPPLGALPAHNPSTAPSGASVVTVSRPAQPGGGGGGNTASSPVGPSPVAAGNNGTPRRRRGGSGSGAAAAAAPAAPAAPAPASSPAGPATARASGSGGGNGGGRPSRGRGGAKERERRAGKDGKGGEGGGKAAAPAAAVPAAAAAAAPAAGVDGSGGGRRK